MKEHKSALLVLSALAALALTACGPEDAQSSAPAQSDAESTSSVVSDASASVEESSASLPSSTAAEDLDNWAGQAWVGEYKGGSTSLIINEDKSTSWETDKTHYPAQIEVMDNGVFHITSASTVPAAEKVDIYTDGTMAYIWHDATSKDRFVLDKNATAGAANTLAKNANGSLILGSVIVNTKAKYFCYKNGEYTFNVKVELAYGDSIEALGAYFDVTLGGEKSTYHTIQAGDAGANTFAVIEDYNLVITEYEFDGSGDDKGLLRIAKNGNQIAFVTLGGEDIDLNDITVGNGTITIKDGGRRLDGSDPAHMQWIYSATKYILDGDNKLYTTEDATTQEPVFQELDLTQSSYSAPVGDDGNLWLIFTPTVGGYLSINETISTTSDGYLAVYLVTSESTMSSFVPSNYITYSDGYGGNLESISNLQLEAGKTYLIKIGAYGDRSRYLGDSASASSNAGKTEAFTYSFSAFDVVHYTGTVNDVEADLVVESYQGTFRGASINGEAIPNASKNGNVITSEGSKIDFDTNPTNPEKVTTTLTITLDPETSTFIGVSNDVRVPVFHVFTEADSGTQYSAVVGADGNLWACFTPTSDGYLTVEEIVMTGSDGYLSIYESTAASYTDTYSGSHANTVAYADNGAAISGGGKITNAILHAGITYIIKAGYWQDAPRDIGTTGSTYAGQTETISFIFEAFATNTYTGDAGDLVIKKAGQTLVEATLAGTAIAGAAINEDGNLFIAGAETIDNSDILHPTASWTETLYDLNANGTYTVDSVPGTRDLFYELTGSGEVEAKVGADGNLWIRFIAPANGSIDVDELTPTSTYSGYSCLAIYASNATSFVSSNAAEIDNEYNKSYYDSGLAFIDDFDVVAGETYIIKVGYYNDKDKTIVDTGSTYAGKTAKVKVTFKGFGEATYTNADGDVLFIKMAGSEVAEAKLNDVVLTGGAIDEDGNFFIAGTATVNNSDRLDPTITSTDTIYELDNDSFSVKTETRTKHIFHEATGTVTVTDTTGQDGNLWIKYTASASGTITVEELQSTLGDGYISIYRTDAIDFIHDYDHQYAAAVGDYGAAANNSWGKITDFEVVAGETYIIKAGYYYDRTLNVTGVSTYNGKGNVESVSITFSAYDVETYTNADGADLNLTKWKGNVIQIMLGDQELEGATINADGQIIVEDVLENDGEGHINMVDYTYTLDTENGTYEVETDITPFVSSDNYVIASTGTYCFVHDEEQNTYSSNNAGAGNSTATMTITINEDGYLSLDYFCSAEGGSYDCLEIKRGSTALTSPATIGSEAGVSGKLFIEVHAGDVITITFKKDGSLNKGKDCAEIKNIILLTAVPSNQGGSGDVGGDTSGGIIDAE